MIIIYSIHSILSCIQKKKKGKYLIIRGNVCQIIGCFLPSISFCTFLYIILHIHILNPSSSTHAFIHTDIHIYNYMKLWPNVSMMQRIFNFLILLVSHCLGCYTTSGEPYSRNHWMVELNSDSSVIFSVCNHFINIQSSI